MGIWNLLVTGDWDGYSGDPGCLYEVASDERTTTYEVYRDGRWTGRRTTVREDG
jgi:hypothetical protein